MNINISPIHVNHFFEIESPKRQAVPFCAKFGIVNEHSDVVYNLKGDLNMFVNLRIGREEKILNRSSSEKSHSTTRASTPHTPQRKLSGMQHPGITKQTRSRYV